MARAKLVKRTFLTKDAALAFMEGLEYVNDSTITHIELVERPNRDFVVKFVDEDRYGK